MAKSLVERMKKSSVQSIVVTVVSNSDSYCKYTDIKQILIKGGRASSMKALFLCDQRLEIGIYIRSQ
ncbi:hypothetical protein CWI77_02180 [Pseudidiomarina planktonica]|nr:hypothetical protein CWI77_02180 [Pseudidiomarina planktonica]